MSKSRTEESSSSKNQVTDHLPNPQQDTAVDLRRALSGGVIAAIVVFLAVYISGRVTGMEALSMLESMLPTTRFLCSAVMTGSATILALMLTLLSLSRGAQNRLASVHYQRVRQIAGIDSVAFVAATVFLLFLNVPIGDADNLSASWFSTLYYTVLVLSSLLGGLLISVVLMLYNTLNKLIEVIDPEVEDAALAAEKENNE